MAMRRKEWTPALDEDMISNYIGGRKTIKHLAAEYGMDRMTVSNRLKRLGVPIRDPSESHKGISMGESHHHWKGGRTVGGRTTTGTRYVYILCPTHPRADSRDGYVKEHVLIAERALGRPLPKQHPVHHFDGDGTNNENRNLVICENEGYHKLLHARTRVARAGGDPNLDRICSTCKLVEPKTNFYPGEQRCKKCSNRRPRAGGNK